MEQNWVFYYEDEFDGATTIYAIQRAKNPKLTKHYKQLQNMIARNAVKIVGHMSASAWNGQVGLSPNAITIQE